MSEHKINHPSHPHQLERMFRPIADGCVACGNKHEGVFFQCLVCPWFKINLDCALLPAKLLIQSHTGENFTHSHPLTVAYTFPEFERRAKFNPPCRICDRRFYPHLWIYKCDKCRYYVHFACVTSKRKEKYYKSYEPYRFTHCPFKDEGDNLLKRYMFGRMDGEMLNHQHPLIIFDKQTLVGKESVSLHNPMKNVQLLCDGCVKPIMTVPIYVCCQYDDEQCFFILHEWCARLPSKEVNYVLHYEHILNLFTKVPGKFFGVFICDICRLPSNGFAYGCTTCDYYVDINCVFIPRYITHDGHPDHFLHMYKYSIDMIHHCKACNYPWSNDTWGFNCFSCDFNIHVHCALLLPKVIKHKCDKHPLSLRYEPVENHLREYFCEICEEEFDPWRWFYHCTTCAQSIHTTCWPLLLPCEKATYPSSFQEGVYKFLNVKFGATLEIEGHSHRLAFVQGLESDGRCIKCHEKLLYEMIFKCLECKYAFHYKCPFD